jgi:hypothetical protein
MGLYCRRIIKPPVAKTAYRFYCRPTTEFFLVKRLSIPVVFGKVIVVNLLEKQKQK